MVLLVVDAQKGIVNDGLHDFERFTGRVARLIDAARKAGTEVVFVRHDDGDGACLSAGNDGFEIYDEFAPREGERIFDKRVNSPFKGTGLLEYMREKGETRIMAVGLQTDYCMDACVKCGFEHGFEMIIPEGTNSTFDNEFMKAAETVRYYNEFMWNGRYAAVVSMEKAIEMMEK